MKNELKKNYKARQYLELFFTCIRQVKWRVENNSKTETYVKMVDFLPTFY